MASAGARGRLAARLRELRAQAWPGLSVTQRQLALAIGVSGPLISAWEKVEGEAEPPAERLEALARFYATDRSLADSEVPRLLDVPELTVEERDRYQQLLDELAALAATPDAQGARASFWHFPDGLPVRIVCSRLPDHEIHVQYADRWHPNYIAALRNGDLDATFEVYGEIRARNPESDVRWLTADQIRPGTFTDGHVVILGNSGLGDGPSALGYYARRLELPVRDVLPANGDEEYDSRWLVRVDTDGLPDYHGHREIDIVPRFLHDRDGRRRLGGGPRLHAVWAKEPSAWDEQPVLETRDGEPLLEYDVALLARTTNPLHTQASVTICSGIFSRGTYGVARAVTDPNIRPANEEYLRSFADPDDFWLLTYVPVFQGTDGQATLAPDLNRDLHVRVRSDQPLAEAAR